MGAFHTHIGELGRLAAYIALDLKNPATTELRHVRGYLDTLDQWHRTLPPPMQLSRLNLADPIAETGHTKRALLQLHILFLGLFIEPFRTCLVDIGNIRLGNITPHDRTWKPWSGSKDRPLRLLASHLELRVCSRSINWYDLNAGSWCKCPIRLIRLMLI
jgi:hypothetical protein